jgi:hypothetical protein
MGVTKLIKKLDIFGKTADFKFQTKSVIGGCSVICLMLFIVFYFGFLLTNRLTQPYFWSQDTFEQALAASGQNVVFPFEDGRLEVSTEITGERNRAA